MLPFLFDSQDFEKGELIHSSQITNLYKCTNRFTRQDYIAKEFSTYNEKDTAIPYLQSFNYICELNHPNVCPIYGYTLDNFDKRPRQMFLSPYFSNGTLDNFLSNSELSLNQRAKICSDIADALNYLHNAKIYIGSLNSTSILINSENSPKIIIPISKGIPKLQEYECLYDDYRAFSVIVFKMLTYTRLSDNPYEFPSDIPQEIQQLIQKCFNFRAPNNTDEINLDGLISFSEIAHIIRTAFSINQIPRRLQVSMQIPICEPYDSDVAKVYYQGLILFNDSPRDIKECIKYIKSAADRLHPLAQYRYAWMLLYGVGVSQNIEQSMKYFKLSANKNVSESQVQYAALALTHHKDITEALKYYQMAFNNGNIEATIKLGELFENIDKIEEAAQFFQIAVNKNNDSDAQFHLAELYEMQNDYEQCAEMYKLSADQSNPQSQYSLACIYENGFGTIKADHKLAAKYAKMSADQQHPSGLWYYGYLLENGIGVRQNFELAAQYYKKSADQNDSFGMWHLGSVLLTGRGVQQDYNEATAYFKMSAKLGNEFGECYYGMMLENGIGVNKNFEEAEKYYKLSANKMNRDGLFNFGRICELKGDLPKAIKMYCLAAKQNHPTALYRYGQYLEKVKNDYENALKYYYRSAQLNDSDAMWSYAMLIEDDDETAKYLKMSADMMNPEGLWRFGSFLLKHGDVDNAEKYFKLSADLNNAEGEWRYAYILEKKGFIAESEHYYQKSSMKNNANGKSNIGFLSENGKIRDDYASNYKSAAYLGSDVGQFNYALVQLKEKKNVESAEHYFKMSAEQDNPSAMYNLSKMYENKDPQIAAEYMKQAAELGLPEAEVSYGLMLQNGIGVPKNTREALKYYKSAAKKGNSDGQYNLGLLLSLSLQFDYAARMFKKASDQGHELAALNLASLYQKGLGVELNPQKAMKYYHIASQSGTVHEAEFNLALMYENGTGVDKDLNKAFELYKKASDGGIKEASFNLATMLENNHSSNNRLIMELFRQAASKNLPEAQFKLFSIYFNGLFDNEKNDDLALYYLNEAANSGHFSPALFKLAVFYQHGNWSKIEQNEFEAVKYYKRAIQAGNVLAKVNLAGIMERGAGGLVKDDQMVAELYKQAAEAGCVVGMFNYAVILEKGKGIGRNLQLAKEYYQKAASQGHLESQQRLEELESEDM